MTSTRRGCHFPGDPRFGVRLYPSTDDVNALRNREMLSTRLLDCLIQRASPPKSSSRSTDNMAIHLGSLGALFYIETSNALLQQNKKGVPVDEWRQAQRKIQKIRLTFEQLFDANNGTTMRLIIPIIESMHFFVLVLDFKFTSPRFFVRIAYYDSMRRSTRGITASTPASQILGEVNDFFHNFVLYKPQHKHLVRKIRELNEEVVYYDCPRQRNGIDCGLFAVGVVLHLIEGKAIDSDTFSPKDIHQLRLNLSNHFSQANDDLPTSDRVLHQQTSRVVRDCFPQLKGTTILSVHGVEEVTSIALSGPSKSSNHDGHSNAEIVAEDATGGNSKVPNHKSRTATNTVVLTSPVASTITTTRSATRLLSLNKEAVVNDVGSLSHPNGSESGSSKSPFAVSSNMDDHVFEEILKERQVEVFNTLDDVEPFIEEYENISGNRLSVLRSLRNVYRHYVCKEHLNCTFQILIGKRRGDGLYTVKRIQNSHSGERRSARASDGRQWKKRRVGKLDNMIIQVIKTKKERPTPADIVKTAATQCGEVIPYMTAYRALNHESRAQTNAQLKNYELIIPYLEALKKCNVGSIIGYSRDDNKCIKDIHVFPGFMNESLQFVRPVVSLDGAHLKSAQKGTLYVASVLSGANEVYPIGFMIATGNEDGATWRKMLMLLKEACPILSQQGFDDNSHAVGSDYHHPFSFISDRDKGLKPALREVFPNNVETSCAKHIEANVCQRYGKQCSRFVYAMAKTFSTRYANHLLEQVKMIKPAAAEYIENINDTTFWRSVDWLETGNKLPPRYGIVTSNTSECVNNMFAEARSLGWLEAVDKILDIMSTRVYTCRMKHIDRHPSDVVPHVAQLLKIRWDAAASMSVVELERGCGDFKVVETYNLQDCEKEEHLPRMPINAGQQQSIHIVKPELGFCSCGLWMEFLYPCRHACAVYRRWKELEFTYILQHQVHPYYTFDYIQKMYKHNIFPVCLDSIGYDGETKPPSVAGRQPGRPPVKRIRRRSEFLDPEESPITCSDCGQKGHNKRTCKNQKRNSK